MNCCESLYFYYDSHDHKIKISNCTFGRMQNNIGELTPDEFYNLSEDGFYEYLYKIFHSKPIICHNGASCESRWEKQEMEQIMVSLSRECNLSCPMCYVKGGGHKDSLERKQLYLSLIDKLKNLKFNTLQLTDWGEPLIYIDEILDILKNYKYCKNLNIITNGTLLTKEVIDKTLSVMNHLFVELDCDSLTKQTYESIRVGADFNIFKNNLKNAISLYKDKDCQSKFDLRLAVTVTDRNKSEIEKIVKVFNFYKLNYRINDAWQPSIEYSY